ncbi:hypothetical protein B0H14DRAFT_2332259, partial [Mycena olivaceomarginata]
LLDSEGPIFLIIAGQPRDEQYRAAVSRVYAFLKKESEDAAFPLDMRRHRRGLFAIITVGLTFGKGQTAPTWLHNKSYTGLTNWLLADPDISRMAGFPSCTSLIFSCPALSDRQQSRPFPQSVFSCAAFNFGSNVWTFKHHDVCNLPFGLCAVQSLGRFDPKRGGHLVLWDLKLVVEFSPGALILLPSATIAHSNIPVDAGDERISFTQFTAGGLFRYVDNRFRTQADFAADDPEEYAKAMDACVSRWADGLALYSTVEELCTPVE